MLGLGLPWAFSEAPAKRKPKAKSTRKFNILRRASRRAAPDETPFSLYFLGELGGQVPVQLNGTKRATPVRETQ
jgi:hypothetical protein